MHALPACDASGKLAHAHTGGGGREAPGGIYIVDTTLGCGYYIYDSGGESAHHKLAV